MRYTAEIDIDPVKMTGHPLHNRSGFVLDRTKLETMSQHLTELTWIRPDETLLQAEPAGEGNMNCTLRITTSHRTFILKQARPWVERYPDIAAPVERAAIEARFYELVAGVETIHRKMPRLLGWYPASHLLMLEDLGDAEDCTFLYRDGHLQDDELRDLIAYLRELHEAFRAQGRRYGLTNRAMRELNYRHLFVVPLQNDSGLDLDARTPGLQVEADRLRSDARYRRAVEQLGKQYLADGNCLLHGDFFPGSWLRTSSGIKVIDPEFCFFGPPEFDLGIFMAHLYLARQPHALAERILTVYQEKGPLDETLARNFGGIEIMRRLLGVAQVPVNMDLQEKTRLLDLSHRLILDQP
jgi:5-methylthioribose kinase